MKEDFSRLISFHPVNDLMHNTTVAILLIINFKRCLDFSKIAAIRTTNMCANDICAEYWCKDDCSIGALA